MSGGGDGNFKHVNYTLGDGTNNSSTSIDSFYFYEVEQFTLLCVLVMTIVFGNSAVLYILLKNKSRNHRMNYFIMHLAIADLLVGLVSVLTDIVWRITVSWKIGNVACKIIKFLQVVVTYASTYVLVALSIDRYDAVRYPMKFSSSWNKARCLIWTAWLISVLFSTPILILYEEKVIQDRLQCWIEFPQPWQWRLYMTVVSVSLFIIPVFIISGCYAIIIAIVWSKSGALTVDGTRNAKDKGLNGSDRISSRGIIPKAKIKTIKVTLIIVTVFILCWSPYIIFDLLQVYGHVPNTQTNVAIATLVQSLAPLNSAANPLIYFVFSTRLCSLLSNMQPLTWIKCKQRQGSEATNQSTLSDARSIPKRPTSSCSSCETHTCLVHASSIL